MNKRIRLLIISTIIFIAGITSVKVSASKAVPIKEEKIQSGDVTLFVRTAGNPASSPILIAVNGGPGMSSHYLKSMEQLAGPDLTVVTFDQRGTGRSSKSSEGYGFQQHVEDIENIRRHLKAEKIVIFGHSFGGILSQRYASLHPEKVSALILMGSGPPAFSAVVAAQNNFENRIQKLVKEGIITGQQPTEASEILVYLLPAYFSDPKFPIPEELKESSLDIEVSQYTYTDCGEWDFREELKVVACPVLFIWGEDDPFGAETAETTKKALLNSKITPITLKKCGHYWHENEEDFILQIKNFMLSDNRDDVKNVIHNSYFNGAFNDLDTESMRKGFHPDFAIFSANGTEISRYPIDVWIKGIESRKSNTASDKPQSKMDCKIVSLDVTGNCAAAKVEIARNGKMVYTDYLSLLKFDDGWKIVAKVYHQHK